MAHQVMSQRQGQQLSLTKSHQIEKKSQRRQRQHQYMGLPDFGHGHLFVFLFFFNEYRIMGNIFLL